MPGNDEKEGLGLFDSILDIVETATGKTAGAKFSIEDGKDALCNFCQDPTTHRMCHESKAGEARTPVCENCLRGMSAAVRERFHE